MTVVFHKTLVSAAEISLCLYSRWSAYFNVPEAIVLSDVPQTFIDYLNSDSIKVAPTRPLEYVGDWTSEEAQNPYESFHDFHSRLESAISRLGKVIVKTNWSAPKDAKWILLNNTLECTKPEDVYLLLNASDHVGHDLDGHAYDECEDKGPRQPVEIVLKKVIPDFNPALEFRVFVKRGQVIGVSQRNLHHFAFLKDIVPKVKATIESFELPRDFPLRDYIMDVYVAAPYDKILVLDINPFTRKWDSLLYTWHELMERDAGFEVRIINETNMGALSRKEYSELQVPIEVVGASVDSEAMVELMKNWLQQGT